MRYITLYNFTDQGMRAVKESPRRLQAGIEQAKAAGMNVQAAYYTQGPYDLVVISEGDDEKTATAFALGIAAQGNVRSVTMRAFEPDEFGEILELIP